MSAPIGWYVAPDSYGNPTLWAANEDRPDYPTALLVRVASNAVLFDGIGALLNERPARPTYGMCTACGSVEVALIKQTGTRDLSSIGEHPEYPTGYGCEVCS